MSNGHWTDRQSDIETATLIKDFNRQKKHIKPVITFAKLLKNFQLGLKCFLFRAFCRRTKYGHTAAFKKLFTSLVSPFSVV